MDQRLARALALLIAFGVTASFIGHCEDAPPPRLDSQEVARMVESYLLWDAMYNDGRGQSASAKSGTLGWAESPFLRNYMRCYQVSRDTYWLDKVIDHFDRMVGNMSDPDEDGFLGWQARVYSVGVARAKPDGDVGQAEIAPAVQRPWVKRGGGEITGHTYAIEFPSSSRLTVRDLTTGKRLAECPYKSPHKVKAVPGTKLTIKGAAKPGARFLVQTTAPEELEYQVHDGMVTYPVAQLIEAVYRTPALHERYLGKAQAYERLLAKHFLDRWQKTWTDLPDGRGLYKFTPHQTQRFPDTSLPHNQYLALARTWLVLQSVPGVERRDEYRDRAARMARNFKAHMKSNGQAYLWNYWDFLPTENVPRHSPEDIGHGSIDVGFAIEARDRGIVFDDEDLRRIASTYVDVMWNRDRDDPLFGQRVSVSQKGKRYWNEWIRLAVVDRRVWPLAMAMYEKSNRSASMGPTLAWLHDRLVGLTDADRAACRRRSAAARQLVAQMSEGLPNTDFEFGEVGQPRVYGWSLTCWGPDQGGRALCAADGYQSAKCIALIGAGPKVNVLAQAKRPIPVDGKAKCIVTAYYRTDGRPGPHMSLLGQDTQGKRVLYKSSPGFKASQTWTQARWSQDIPPSVATLSVLLRNNGRGTVYWDRPAVALE